MSNTYTQKIEQLHDLAKTDGFIYAVCHLVRRDFLMSAGADVDTIDDRDRINLFEFQSLLGLWLKYGMSFEQPKSLNDLVLLIKQIPIALDEMHDALFHESVQESGYSFSPAITDIPSVKNLTMNKYGIKELSIYSSTGVFESQFLKLASDRYEEDKEWLEENLNINLAVCVEQVEYCLSEYLHKANSVINSIYHKWKHLVDDTNTDENDVILFDLMQYANDDLIAKDKPSEFEIIEEICIKLLDLFTITVDTNSSSHVKAYWELFSCEVSDEYNQDYFEFSDLNKLLETPIVRLGDNRYFIPLNSLLPKTLYENLYYWILNKDKIYFKTKFRNHLGDSSEILVEQILKKIFGDKNVKRAVLIKQGKTVISDIDIIAFCGTKAISVQVKSKKLTLQSVQGDAKKLKQDYIEIVQNAYEQNIKCVNAIKNKDDFRFFCEKQEIKMPARINEIHMLCITPENIPGLYQLNKMLLSKDSKVAHPHVMTVFDLDLLAEYLPKPYLFIDYVQRRIENEDLIYSQEEIDFLSYHLKRRIWQPKEYHRLGIDSDFSNSVKRDYYSNIAGQNPNDDFRVRIEWLDDDFRRLMDEISANSSPECIDIVLDLIKYNIASQRQMVAYVKQVCSDVYYGKKAKATCTIGSKDEEATGVTIVSCADLDELIVYTNGLSEVHYYRSKKPWVGLGFFGGMLRIISYHNQPWRYDAELEKLSKEIKASSYKNNNNSNIGRNEACPCGSGKKFKKCCGRD